MRIIISLVILVPILVSAQIKQTSSSSNKSGIKWTGGLSWQQVKQKAKQDGKYIFLDCYTTWCGPCKKMDKNVYVNDSVGNYFNEYFINIKVQMDKTKNDNPFVQSWYNDADEIGRQFRVEAFPCFIFLSPDGNIVHKATGYTEIDRFLDLAQVALKPVSNYVDPYSDYDSLLAEYKSGKLNYERMLYLIKTAQKFDTAIVRQLIDSYSRHVTSLDEQYYTKDNIEFLAMNISNSNSSSFQLFYKHAKKVDNVMLQKGYAEAVIDKLVYNEVVVPFFKEQNKNPVIPMTGMYLNGIEPDFSEADWKKLTKVIKLKFDRKIARRNVLASRVEWYKRHCNFEASTRYKLIQLKKYPPNLNKQSVAINGEAWVAFMNVNNKKILNRYIKWMDKIVSIYGKNCYYIDTYANLLYKTGRKIDAIKWEEKAIEVGKAYGEDFKMIVEKMKRGEPTYGVTIL